MLKKINTSLNIVVGSFVGVFVGNAAYVFWDYRAHSDLYVMQSAPWYTSILVNGAVTFAVLLGTVMIKRMIRRTSEGQNL